MDFQGKGEVYLAKHWAITADWYKPGYSDVNTMIVGDVVNLSNRPVTDIIISAKTFKNGNMIEDASHWYPIKKILRPGGASPFFIEPLYSGFDDYEIWISNYKFSDNAPNDSPIDIIELDVKRNIKDWDTYTIKCTDSGEYPTALYFVLIWYDERGYLNSIEFHTPEYPDQDDCRLKGNKTSNFPFFNIPSDESFEFFLIEGYRNILFNAGEPGKLNNPKSYEGLLSETYSKYHPDSLRPKYMDGLTKVQSFLEGTNLDLETPYNS